MKYIAARHNSTVVEPLKKARPPHGGIAAMKLYYTVQIYQTILCNSPGGSMTCRAVFVVSYGPKIFLHFFLCGKRFCAQNLYRWTLCYRKRKVPPPSTSERG